MDEKQIIVDLNTFADGALLQRVNEEMQKVVDNIYDPNTDDKKARSISIKLEFVPKKDRKGTTTRFSVSSKLMPLSNPETEFIIGVDQYNQLTARELQSSAVNQIFYDVKDGQVKTDIGQPVEEAEAEQRADVVQFRSK